MSDEHTTSGHCLCGAVAFEYSGPPNWVVHCHCESCRRATSSPMTTWVSVPRRALRFTRGRPRDFRSSPQARRSFCADCGSPLTYEPDSAPEEVHLYAAALEDPNAVAPSRHVFVEEQLDWLEIDDDLPRYATTGAGEARPVRHGPRDGTKSR